MFVWAWKKTFVVGGICGVVVLAAGGWRWTHRPVIPSSISRQVSFEIFVPSGADRKSVTYDSNAQLLNFNIHADGTSIAFTEQATPGVIASSPTMLVNGFGRLKNETALATAIGTAYVGNNQTLNGQQTLGMNTQGTLLFARPNKNLTQAQWRKLFQFVTIIK